MILFCNLVCVICVYIYVVCVNVHKICDDKFGSCKKSFPWLGQKVNKKIDAYGAMMLTTLTQICTHGHGMMPRPGKTFQHRSVF